MGDGAPRVRLPGGDVAGLPLIRPPGTLAQLSALGVGDRIVGVEDDGVETVHLVVAVAVADGPTLEDVVDRDPRTGDLRIVVGVGAYDPTSGAYAATMTISARPAAPSEEPPDPT